MSSLKLRRNVYSVPLLCVIGVLSITVGCKKSKITPSLHQQLQGKWAMKNAIGNYEVMGEKSSDTTRFTSSDYFDFKPDGSLFIKNNLLTHNGKWKIVDNKLFITETSYMDFAKGFDLPILTQTEAQLYYTDVNSFSTLEQKLNLSR